jgi:ATP-dependent RNA helicase DDX5/DBP2
MARTLYDSFIPAKSRIKLTFSSAIHGDKQQNERDWVLNEFKTGKSPIMVATDVASRGIGMIETPFPGTATPSRLHSSALLSTLRRSLDCVNCPGSFVSFGSLS